MISLLQLCKIKEGKNVFFDLGHFQFINIIQILQHSVESFPVGG